MYQVAGTKLSSFIRMYQDLDAPDHHEDAPDQDQTQKLVEQDGCREGDK